ncbi:MAG: hypothetical protein WC788_02495 [Candidatus Paceibacterota bacterium]|jgi:hypothetical protein
MKNKNIDIALFVFISSIFILGAILAVVLSKREAGEKGIDFAKCSILKDNCADKSCDLNYLCNERESKSCKIYDCGGNYGIETADLNDVIEKKYREKSDREKANADVTECGGRLAVIAKGECKDDLGEIKVRVLTGEKCDIAGFTLKIDGQDKMVPFQKDNDAYKLMINKCGEVTDITAIGEGGVQIKESY